MSVARAVEAVFDLVEGLVDTVVHVCTTNDFGDARCDEMLKRSTNKHDLLDTIGSSTSSKDLAKSQIRELFGGAGTGRCRSRGVKYGANAWIHNRNYKGPNVVG